MKKKSIEQISEKIKREIAKIKELPDSEVSFADIPLQNPDDPKWKNAVVGKFYRPIKKPVTVRLDTDIVAWLKSKDGSYQQHLNATLRAAMMAEMKL